MNDVIAIQLIAWLFSFQQPAVLPVFLLLSIVPAQKYGRATGRALAMVVGFTIALHVLAWLAYGQVRAVHAACAAMGLGVLIPIAVRSRRTYPLIVAAAALLSAIAMTAASFETGVKVSAAEAVAGLANLMLAAALWSGLMLDWWRGPRPAEQRIWQSI